MIKILMFCLAFMLSIGSSVAAEKVVVVDGDSLEIGRNRIRLEGIDAPEYHQDCLRADKTSYPCGLTSRRYLEKMVRNGRVRCDKKATDRYKRNLCTCYVFPKNQKKINLNAEMVRAGQAVVYRNQYSDYSAQEKEAKREKRGIWQGKFMKPQLYRILNK